MKKLLSFTLILALVLSSVSFAFAEPDTWAFKGSDTGKLQAYDKSQNRWENSNIKGYKELEYVSMRYVSGDKSITQYGIEFDYYENGSSEKYGFDDVHSEVVFYDGSGNPIEMSGRYDTSITKSETSGKMIFTIDITSSSGLPSEFAIAFEARLAGPGQSSQWSGASLHARMIADGNKEVSIVAPPYGTIEVTKEFTGLERPDEVVIHFDGDSGNYQITLDSPSWNGMIPNVEPGEYEVSEESIGDYWQAEYTPETVNVVLEETVQVTVTNTYNPPVTTSGSITFVKEWEGDFVPESGYVTFTVNGEYPFARVEYPSWTTTVEDLTLGTYELTKEWVFETGDQTYYNVSGIPQTVELTETTPDATITVVNHMNPPTGDVMFEKVWIDEPPEGLTTVSTVWAPYGSEDGTTISMFANTSWTAGPVTQPVGDYTVEEIGLLPGWTSEIEYKVGEGDWMDYGEYVTVPKDDTLYIKFINEYGKGDIMFEKVWIDEPPEGLTTVSTVWAPYGSEDGTTISMFANTSWTAGPVTQPMGDYTVEEIGLLPGWTSEIEYKVGEGDWMDYGEYVTVPKDGTIYIRFLNDYEESPTGTVEVQKLFEGVDVLEGFGDMEFRIQFTLRFPDGETVNTITDTYTGSEWLATPRYFNGIPAGSGYMVEETIFEMTTPVSGYWTESVTPTSFEVLGGQTAHVDVTNTYSSEPTYGVAIEKTVNPTSHYTGGGPVSYTITFENIGNTATYDWVDFDDLLDEGMTTGDMFNTEAWIDGVFITGDGGEIFGAPMPMTSYGGFEPGDVITITYDYDSSGLGIGTYNNTITGCAWMGGIEEPDDDFTPEMSRDIGPAISQPICDTDTASFDVVRRPVRRDDDDPGVRIEKTVDVDEASVGDTVTYTIKVTNNGDVSLTDVMVVDDIIDVEWDIGDLSKGDSITEEFEYEIQEGDFEDGEFENIAEVTADSREGKASDTDDAVVEEETIDLPPVTPPETTPVTPPEIVVPTEIPPQALPQTGQAGIGFIYSLGSVLLLAGAGFGRKKRK